MLWSFANNWLLDRQILLRSGSSLVAKVKHRSLPERVGVPVPAMPTCRDRAPQSQLTAGISSVLEISFIQNAFELQVLRDGAQSTAPESEQSLS